MNIIDQIEEACQCTFEVSPESRRAASREWLRGQSLLCYCDPRSGYWVLTLGAGESPWGTLNDVARNCWECDWPGTEAGYEAFTVDRNGQVEHVAGTATWRQGIAITQ